MKKIAILFAFIIGGVLIFNSCQKMEDIHSEYLKDGDIIYASKPLVIQSFAGKKRIKLRYYLVNAVNVNKCVVEWDEGASSQTIDISPNMPIDSIDIMIDNLEEKSYIFKVFTLDTHGNRSVKEQVTGSAYDTKYQLGLTNRSLLGIEGGGTIDSLVVSWGTAPSGNTGVEMVYNNREGVAVTKVLSSNEDRIVIRAWESEGKMTYRSFFIPEENAIDTFASASAEVMLPQFIEFNGEPVDKTNWTIVDLSGEEPAEAQWGPPIQGLAAATIDGDNSTFWHSPWASANPPHPHFFTIDFGDVVKMNAFELVKRANKNDCQKRFTVEVSLDNVTFTSLGTFTYEQANASQKYQVLSLPLARYVKYTVLEGWTGANHSHLAEFNVEGQIASQLDRTNWEVVDFSTEEPAEANWGPPIQGQVAAILDGDFGTFWHTQWDGGSPGYPHYFVLDMKEATKLLAVGAARRQNDGRGQTKFIIYTSNDGVNFEEQGTFDFNAGINDEQIFALSFLPEARYIKYEATEGSNFFAFMSEFNVYGNIQ